MQHQMKLPISVERLLRCPICKQALERAEDQLRCLRRECGAVFPVVNGIPVLINEHASLFSIEDFLCDRDTFFPLSQEPPIKRAARRLLPSITGNVASRRNYQEFAKLLASRSSSPVVLVIGGGMLGEGMETLLAHPSMELVETDVSWGPRTKLICDAHDIPFAGGSFDGVIAQAVLEHVVDPHRCVDEIHRVLKDGGLVYAETPFIQQVHGGRYDFTRFTHLGHRRLFRRFEEIDSGAACGPGTALAWSCLYFFLSLARSKSLRTFIRLAGRLTLFHLKYFDYYLVRKQAALDAASGLYFIGQKSSRVLSDRELVKLYRGGV